MYSYASSIEIYPKPSFEPLESWRVEIDAQIRRQSKSTPRNSDEIVAKVYESLAYYYRLVGVDALSGKMVSPGILLRYTNALENYFDTLIRRQQAQGYDLLLSYSGVVKIKLRYKYTPSVVKKLVKIALKEVDALSPPSKPFFKGGALHDLIGMLFVCSSSYEREWTARALYAFFDYDNRTDDHLIFGFYDVKRPGGYRGLHCDYATFAPKFDPEYEKTKDRSEDPTVWYRPAMSDKEVLASGSSLFNIELQIHTSMQHHWATLEHRYSYDILAKGKGRSKHIEVQWRLMSDMMNELERRFERLQVETEQSRFDTDYRKGYTFVKNFLTASDAKLYEAYSQLTRESEIIEKEFENHEISRQAYVRRCQANVSLSEKAAEKYLANRALSSLFLLHGAFVYLRLAYQERYFKREETRVFAKEAMRRYLDIYETLSKRLDTDEEVILCIVAILRYEEMAQRHGLGLVHTGRGVLSEEESRLSDYRTNYRLFKHLITIMNTLSPSAYDALSKDDIAYFTVVHRIDILTREWEIFVNESEEEHRNMLSEVQRFRKRYLSSTLRERFERLLEAEKIENVNSVVRFYTTLVWHGLLNPLEALSRIVHFSSYDTIETTELFYYESACYRHLRVCRSEDTKTKKFLRAEEDFYRKNMIRQLFKIEKNESRFAFLRAKYHYERITGDRFRLDHFSGELSF